MNTTKRSLRYCGLMSALLTVIALVPTAVVADTAMETSADNDVTEVIVTARKRTEVLQDVPLSISAVGSVELDRRNVQDVNNLHAQVPGLYTAPGSVSATSELNYLTMRGVGFNAGLEPAVGVFIDGMYQPQIGFDAFMLDLQRVEVLRGPQGTLFGRNTQGGAVNMITRKPGAETRGRVAIEAAEFNTLRAQASVSGPIAGNVYGGISAAYGRSDGFIYNPTLNQHQDDYEQAAVRGTLRWVPFEGLDITLMADASQRDYNEVVRGVRLDGDHTISPIDQDKPESKSNHGVQLNISYDLNDSLRLTSITGSRYSASESFLDVDNRASPPGSETLPAYGTLAPNPVTVTGATLATQVDQTFTSQELRLERNGEAVNWLLGAYYFRQEQNQTRQRHLGPKVAPTIPSALYIYEDFEDIRQGSALFGQLSYRPTQKVELTIGTRYSQETVDGTGEKVSVFGAPLNRVSYLPRNAHPEFDNLSWMASASYKFTPDLSVYATYAEGWKAGGVERYPARTDDIVYKDESSQNYEIGLKSILFDRKVVFNAAAYHIKIQNQQLNNVIPDPRGGPAPITVVEDAARSHVNGFETELVIRPVTGLTLTSNLSYSDGVLDDFVRSFSPTDTFDMSGTSFENVPKTTAYASALYHQPLGNGRTLEWFAEYAYVGEITFQDNTRLSRARDQLTTPAYDRMNLSLSYVTPGGLRVTGYVNNAFDSFDYTYASSDPFVGGDVFVVPLPPRQFGVRLSKTF